MGILVLSYFKWNISYFLQIWYFEFMPKKWDITFSAVLQKEHDEWHSWVADGTFNSFWTGNGHSLFSPNTLQVNVTKVKLFTLVLIPISPLTNKSAGQECNRDAGWVKKCAQMCFYGKNYIFSKKILFFLIIVFFFSFHMHKTGENLENFITL